MKKIGKNIFAILNNVEKTKLIKLILLDAVISILDILFLVMLLFVIHFYTGANHSLLLTWFPFFNKYPLLLVVIFFVLFSIKNFFGFHVLRKQLKFVYAVASRLSKKNLISYLDGSYNDYVNIDSSVHIRKISQQPIEFCHYVLQGFQQIISQSILILIAIIAILVYNPFLFPLLFAILAPSIMLTAFLMKKKLTAIRKAAKPSSEKSLQYLKEALSGFIESNLYDRRNFFAKRYYSSQSTFNNFLSEQQAIQNMPSRLIEVFAVFGLLILVFVNTFIEHTPSVQIITIGAFMAAAYKIIPGIVKILNSNGQIKTYWFTVTDLLQTKNDPFIEKETSNPVFQSVEFKNISFGYKNDLVLDDFSFSVSQGDFIGLSGMSGKGKTTAINILLGFLEPDGGHVLINNVNTTSSQRKQYWKNISYVKQQPLVIFDNIVNNITLDESTYDHNRLQDVVHAAGLKRFANEGNKAYDATITENGRNISGGQRQRLSIARALYKDADLIILDEPFSELDRTSEDCLLNHFSELARSGKMVILITHNKESLAFCDKIISLDEK